MVDLSGRTVLLTGASGGIGGAVLRVLAESGAHVIGQYRSVPMGGEEDGGSPRGRVDLVQADLSTPGEARDLWTRAERLADVDVLVLNAATMLATPFDGEDTDWDDAWAELLAVNVIGAGALLRQAVLSFAERGGGTAIVMSSWAAEQGSRILDASGYAASKAAVRNLAQTLARHHARAGVRIYVIAPGVVDAGMGVAGQTAAEREAVAAGLVMGAAVPADEVAELVAYLASDACPSLTGATVDLNGASYIR